MKKHLIRLVALVLLTPAKSFCSSNSDLFTTQAFALVARTASIASLGDAATELAAITSRATQRYQPFQDEPQVAVYPGGLEPRIFDFFPKLKLVHFINKMPFRVPFDIASLKYVRAVI